MKKTNTRLRRLLTVVALCGANGVASAAVITWSAEALGTAGVASVSTLGTSVYAVNSAGETTTVNTVEFVGSANGGQASLDGGNITVVNPDNGNDRNDYTNVTGFEVLLNSTYWAHRNPDGTGLPDSGGTGVRTTINLNNLTVGEDYLVQVFSSNTRSGRSQTPAIDRDLATEFISPIANGSVADVSRLLIFTTLLVVTRTTMPYSYASFRSHLRLCFSDLVVLCFSCVVASNWLI